MLKKISLIILFSSISLFSININAEYKEVACSTDQVYNTNNCNQCFVWESKNIWESIALMTDIWHNKSSLSQAISKEEQEDPSMISINATEWKMIPETNNFWQNTEDLNKLYDKGTDFYILPAWKQVIRIKSSIWYGYKLESTKATKDQNIGLLVFPIVIHDFNSTWEIKTDSVDHKECVLFKLTTPTPTTPVTNTKPTVSQNKKLPDTWTEHILLILLSLWIWFFILRFSRRKNS